MSDDSGPDWVRDALHQTADEVRAFLRTAVELTLHPARFAIEWSRGQRRALNPLGFIATAFAIFGVTRALYMAELRQSDDQPASLLREGLGALLPFVYFLALGAVQHGVLRLFGSRRPLRDSCAMALYAGGGPATAANVLTYALTMIIYFVTRDPRAGNSWPVVIGAMASLAIFWSTLSTAVGALHASQGIRWWHILAANCVAMLITGALFAALDPPGEFGLHLVVGPHRRDGAWHFMLALRG